MALTSEKRQLRDEQIDTALEEIEERDLVKWYGRWRNEPWTYAVVKTLQKIPYTILVLSVVSWEKTRLLFTDPVRYLADRGVMILLAFFCFTVIFHFAWRSKAVKYFLLAKHRPHLQLHDDSRVSAHGRKASGRLATLYRRWGKEWWHLTLLMALAVPTIFFCIYFLLHGLKENQWSVQAFLAIFEDETETLVFAIFFFFGALLGYGIRKEIKQNFHLMQKEKSSSEF